MEVPRQGSNQSHSCDLHQWQVLNPLNHSRNSVALALLPLQCRSQLWLGFSPWPGNFYMLWVQPLKKKKKKKSFFIEYIKTVQVHFIISYPKLPDIPYPLTRAERILIIPTMWPLGYFFSSRQNLTQRNKIKLWIEALSLWVEDLRQVTILPRHLRRTYNVQDCF